MCPNNVETTCDLLCPVLSGNEIITTEDKGCQSSWGARNAKKRLLHNKLPEIGKHAFHLWGRGEYNKSRFYRTELISPLSVQTPALYSGLHPPCLNCNIFLFDSF